MDSVVAFAKPTRPVDFLDFSRFPKLERRRDLVFQHRGELYEDSLAARFVSSVTAEIRAFDARGRFYATCEEAFLNLVFWMGTRWPPQAHSIVLLNAQNKTQNSQGKRVGGRFCDVWWFSEDRHVLYSIIPPKVGQQSSWPPRDDDIYHGAPVGTVKQPWPLLHDVVRDLLPGPLLQKLLRLRSGCKMTVEEHQLLQFMEVPPRPPERLVQTPAQCGVLPHYDVAAVEDYLGDFEEDLDVVAAECGPLGLWRWVYCLNLAKPCLLREGCRKGDLPYLDFTEPLMDMVRMRDMGLDPLADRGGLLESCVDVVLDCCPPSWRREAKMGTLVCPAPGMVLLTVKSWRLLLGAVPLPLRVCLELRSPSGLDPACVWTMIGTGAERKVCWINKHGLEDAMPRSFLVKNTRFARDVRDGFGLKALQQLTWADLKMFEVFESSWAEAWPDEELPTPNVKAVPSTRAEVLLPPEAPAPRHDVSAACLQEDIREANEAARRERAQRRQMGQRRPQGQPKKERRHQREEAPAVEATPKAQPVPKKAAIAKVPIKENDDDLDALLATPEDRGKPSETFRAVGKLMKRALWKERRTEVRRRLCELCQ